jgi:hypothetical protein
MPGHDMKGGDVISLPLHQQPLAVVAEGMVPRVARHVAQVDISNPFGHGPLPEADQGCHRRGGQAVQPVAGEKSQEMEGVIGTQVLQYPGAHTPDHLFAVPVPGDHQVGHFKMDALPVKGGEGGQHRFQSPAIELPVNIVADGFEVHVGPVQHPAQGQQRLPVDKAV